MSYVLRCEARLTTRRFSNFKEYQEYKASSFQFSESSRGSSHINLLFWKSSKSHASRTSESEETQELVKFFSETNGEIYVSEATCITYTMEIGSYTPLDFTDDFKSLLRGIHLAASSPSESAFQKRVFKSFVEDFGTFYLSKVDMGAKISIETRFSSRATSNAKVQKRMRCIVKSLGLSSSSGFETPEIDVELNADIAKASYKIQHINLGSSDGQNSARNE